MGPAFQLEENVFVKVKGWRKTTSDEDESGMTRSQVKIQVELQMIVSSFLRI